MIGLYQVDGKWPNLALMKLSAWMKKQGEQITRMPLEFDQCETVYASKVFIFTQGNCNDDYLRGGTGWPDWKDLPCLFKETEHIYPDYEEYNCDYAMGFLTRGCVRRCGFCVVPDKEGMVRHNSYLPEWWHGQQNIRLLDANITASQDFNFYMQQLITSNARVDFSQGIDSRLLDSEKVGYLSKVRLWGRLHTAWDDPNDDLPKGIRLLLTKFHPDRILVYVLIGFNTTPEEDLFRVEKLRELKTLPFVMTYDKSDPYQLNFSRWVNRKAIFRSVQWKDYKLGGKVYEARSKRKS